MDHIQNKERIMKQTTIRIEIEEGICGAILWPKPSRPRSTTGFVPNPYELKLWNLITKQDSWTNKEVDMDDQTSGDWWTRFGARVLRVCNSRSVKTKVRTVSKFPNGDPRLVSVTAYWEKSTVSHLDKLMRGTWTLRQMQQGKRNIVIAKIKATLDCDGDELYDYLPDGFPEGWEVESDGNTVVVFDPKDDGDGPTKWFSFTFKHSTIK